MDLGKTIHERVKQLPVFKSFPEKTPDSFVICPETMVDLRQAGGDREFRHTVSVFSTARHLATDAINYMIRVGKERIEAGTWCLWLHAVKLSGILRMPQERMFTGTVTYIFRTKKLAYAEEPPPGPEPAPEAEPMTGTEPAPRIKGKPKRR